MTLLFSMLDYIGVENGRTRVEWVSAAEGVKFSQTMNEFVEKIHSLGKNVSLEDFVYDGFCGANLSKYMIEASKLEGKTMVCLKPCDTYSFNQLLKEHRVDREKAYIVGVGCKGKLDIEKIRKMGIKGIRGISGAEITGDAETLTVDTVYGEKTCAYKDAMLERCHVCKGKEHKIYDELIGESKETKDADRFAEVERIEAMSPEEKFAFWQSELSKCIRCNSGLQLPQMRF